MHALNTYILTRTTPYAWELKVHVKRTMLLLRHVTGVGGGLPCNVSIL